MTTEKNMLDVFKSILQEGMEIDKVKEYNENYKFIMSYKGMTAKCQLTKVCALGCERQNCMNVINNAISSMYINAGDLKEAKAWLDGEKWGNEPNNDIGVRKIDGYIERLNDRLKSHKEQLKTQQKHFVMAVERRINDDTFEDNMISSLLELKELKDTIRELEYQILMAQAYNR